MNTTPNQPTLEQLAEVFGYELKRRPLRPPEAATLMNCAVATLQDMRHDGTGPRYFKQSKFCFYAERDLLEWLVAGERRNTSQQPARRVPA